MPTSDVFLSYNRADRDAAQRCADALAGEGLDVWWDSLLQGGNAFAQETEEALEAARCVVVLWSASAIQSHWVRDEATRGRERGCLVPVSLDGMQPPLGFRQLQFLDLSLNPKASVVHAALGDIALIGGDAAAARRHYEAEASALSRLRGLAIAAHVAGDTAGAEGALAKLIAEFGDNSFYQQGQMMAQSGRTGDALDRLERALTLGDSGLVLARHDPLLDPLRREPRFGALLARLGFPAQGKPG